MALVEKRRREREEPRMRTVVMPEADERISVKRRFHPDEYS